ncbi:class I SAM-dependent methyltransferase [Bradyrhizobium sp. SZCCHNRI1009]|uniref:class I SAM-dependent methyltransferase n=1 Tax=Bradyrhizobium sp. SZCCHNRI1009 TaxID=3057277 RepID=UPI002916EE22|nr:class I SAM-dependent methyltransferase [Bradyrhizobium sp. SZCCHNRI1009]
MNKLEQKRLELQAQLDSAKNARERNKLGQFATPTALADDVLQYARSLLPTETPIRFLDPAVGTGSFYSALTRAIPAERIARATGIEIDPHYALPSRKLWADSPLEIRIEDFTQIEADPTYNLLICNPPYVRHHHMQADYKARLQLRTELASGSKIGGLAGLYCYFMGLSQAWLAPDAISGWLIPSEFMDVNYGRALKRYLLERVTLLHIHRFDPNEAQFDDALVSSAVVWFRNALPSSDHSVRFTFGGTLSNPAIERDVSTKALTQEAKWTRFPVATTRAKSNVPTISDFFKIKRGLATGDNGYFILNRETVESRNLPRQFLRPILPSPRYIVDDIISADDDGLPLIERQLFLLDPRLPEDEIKENYSSLWTYLQEGRERGLNERYLCSHRKLWYSQEDRPPPPIVCTYMGRGDAKNGRPFRFILNESQATIANVYLAMYPTPVLEASIRRDPTLLRQVWEALNRITPEQLLGEGRVYGGGLNKLEPKELANVPAGEIAALLPDFVQAPKQTDMFAVSDAA